MNKRLGTKRKSLFDSKYIKQRAWGKQMKMITAFFKKYIFWIHCKIKWGNYINLTKLKKQKHSIKSKQSCVKSINPCICASNQKLNIKTIILWRGGKAINFTHMFSSIIIFPLIESKECWEEKQKKWGDICRLLKHLYPSQDNHIWKLTSKISLNLEKK